MSRKRLIPKAQAPPEAEKPAGRDVPLPLVTRFQVAECLGADPTTVAKWERAGLPVAERGSGGRASKYALPAVIRWYVAHERAKYERETGTLNLDDERARQARAQTRKTELEIRRREGELVAVAEVTALWSELLGTLRATLLALPAALAAPLDATAKDSGPRAVEALLRDRMTSALHELARWRPSVAPEAST
jgi:phage terminase Nu1 subunit (DNA packaging protein)